MKNNAGQLTTTDRKKWVKDTIRFVLGVLIIYLTSLVVIVNQPGHELVLNDLKPTSLVIGSILTWIIASLQNLVTKYLSNTSD